MATLALSFFLLVTLIIITLTFQFVRNFRVVGANQVAVVAGKSRGGYRTYQGGRVVVWPIINKRFDLDLRPRTATVEVQSAIARGMVPLNVVATVSFAISSSGEVLQNAIRRILSLNENWNDLENVAASIIEGHLRDSIATMTPEQVMRDKDELVRNMIRVCKSDLEAIGLEITTMNIADVDDHRLDGMGEGDLYIGLLNRVESASARSQARSSEARAKADSAEESHRRRAEVEVRRRDNDREALENQTSASVADERQRGAVGMEKAQRSGVADLAGVKATIEAERSRIDYLNAQYRAEILTPAEAEKQRLVLVAEREATEYRGVRESEIQQLGETIRILEAGGENALNAYLIDNFESLIQPFSGTMMLFPADKVNVLSGFGGQQHEQISAVEAHPIEAHKAFALDETLGHSPGQRQNGVSPGTAAASQQSTDQRR
ncbi:SPFH domain-containing protein [Salinicola avicenniae]|uniref:SPFH domain-containing protein n=1 Tax=Salinicola avicenniae TaxID=2916836 RepID=UPI0020749C1D|nr:MULTISPECIES: flotillin family protein [unclassified Salinicola]